MHKVVSNVVGEKFHDGVCLRGGYMYDSASSSPRMGALSCREAVLVIVQHWKARDQ